jgi:hypothetical protein
MPSPNDHIQLALRNLQLSRALCLLEYAYREWAVTTGFYGIVHYCEALLYYEYDENLLPSERGKRHSRAHQGREIALAGLTAQSNFFWLSDFLVDFQRLRVLSFFARYGTFDNRVIFWERDPLWTEFTVLLENCQQAFVANYPDASAGQVI